MRVTSSRRTSAVTRLLDGPDVVRRKIARAVTDSDTGPGAVRHDPDTKPGVSNLLELVAARGHDLEVITEQFNDARVALETQQEAAKAAAAKQAA